MKKRLFCASSSIRVVYSERTSSTSRLQQTTWSQSSSTSRLRRTTWSQSTEASLQRSKLSVDVFDDIQASLKKVEASRSTKVYTWSQSTDRTLRLTDFETTANHVVLINRGRSIHVVPIDGQVQICLPLRKPLGDVLLQVKNFNCYFIL